MASWPRIIVITALTCNLCNTGQALAGSIVQVLDFRGHRALDRPYDIAVDADGSLLIPSWRTHSVIRIRDDAIIDQPIGPAGDGNGGKLLNPVRLALGPSGDVYAVASGSGNALRATPDGCVSELFRSEKPYVFPSAVAIDQSGNVFFAWVSDTVTKLSPEGQVTEIINAEGDGLGHPLMTPWALTVDGDGNVYVTAVISHNVFKITPSGEITQILDATGDGAGHTLNDPTDVAVDSFGNVFVTGGLSLNVFRISASGQITEILDRFGTGGTRWQLSGPVGVATDSVGNVYVADFGGVFKITPLGTKSRIMRADGAPRPNAVTVDAGGNVYVTAMSVSEYSKEGYPCCPGSNTVYKIPPGGEPELIFDGVGQAEVEEGFSEWPEFGFPEDMAIDAAGNAYVVSWATDSVFRVTPLGGIRRILDWGGDGLGHYLNNPSSVAVDPQGNVFVAGYFSDNAFKITPEGTITQIMDETGDGIGHALSRPGGIAVGPDGVVYVCGLDSDNVFRIAQDGSIVQVLDSTGDGVHVLDAPADLAIDSDGNVYVGGGESDNVFQVQPDGSVVQTMNPSGDGQGNTLNYPRRVRIAEDGTIYVLSTFNSKAFSVSPSGIITQILDYTGDGQGHGMSIPLDLVLDAQGNAYVSGRDTNNVIKITLEGGKSQIIGANGDGRGNLLNGGSALGVDAMGRVYVGGLNSDNVFRVTPDVNISQGDFDGDSDADLNDFAALQNCFGTRPALPDLCTRLDLNLDRKVNLADAGLFVSFLAHE